MRRTFSLLLLTAMFAVMAPLGAFATHPEDDPDPCNGTFGGNYAKHSDSAPGQVRVPIVQQRGMIVPINDAKNGPFYADVRELVGTYELFSIWLYQETNGRPGLTRGGRAVVPDTPGTSGEEPCEEARSPVKPDLDIF